MASPAGEARRVRAVDLHPLPTSWGPLSYSPMHSKEIGSLLHARRCARLQM